MTDPSDEGVRPLEATGPSLPTGSRTPSIADRDGGVSQRLTARCRIASWVLLGFGTLLLLLGVLRTWSASSVLLVLLAAGALAWALTLSRRAGLWSSVASAPLSVVVGIQATVGPPKRLSPGIPGAPLKRRLGAMVVPIRTEVDPQPGGGALVVHARADGLGLVGGDAVRVWSAVRDGTGSTGSAGSAASTRGERAGAATSRRFVLCRPADGAVFLATTRLSDTW